MIKIQKFNENGMGSVVAAQPSPIPGKQVPDNQPVVIPCGVTYENVYTNLKKFEDACATLGNTGGMGVVVSAQPSATPGDVAGGTPGSGDIGHVFGTSTKNTPNLKRRKRRIKKVTELSQEIFESLNDEYVTFEMTGSPKDTRSWRYKENFESDMYRHGFRHTTLTKKTDLLVAEDEHFGSIKWNKAKSFGIPIMTFTEAWEKREQIYMKKFGISYEQKLKEK